MDAAAAPVQAAPQGNGVGPVPAVAAADPAIVALLQELLVSQQAIVARLTNVENNQARPQLQQYQQAQPAHQPQQAALQLSEGSAHSMASATKDAIQQDTVTAGVKANAEQAADLWLANEGPKVFIARGGVNVSEEINRGLLVIVLNTVAHVSDAVLKQLKTMSEFGVEDFFTPVAIGETPRAMPAEIHCATFVASLMETLEYGMEGAPPVCKQRVAPLRSKLEQVQKLFEVYLRRHFNSGGALGEGSTAAAVKHEHRPARRHESARGAGRRAVQEAHLRCASPRSSEFHGHPHQGAGGGGRRV